MNTQVAEGAIDQVMQSTWRPLWTSVAASGLIFILIILLSECMDRRQKKKLVNIADFDRGLIDDEKNRLAAILEMLRRYLRQESLQFLHEIDTENPHHYMLKHIQEQKSSRRSNRGSESGQQQKKSGRITNKKHTKQKSTLSTITKSDFCKRHSISFRILVALSFVCGLALARYYFLSKALRESIFLFKTFKTANDLYLGLCASQMVLSSLAIYNPGDTIHYKHPIDFFNEEIQLVMTKAVPTLLQLGSSNLDLMTGELLRGLLHDVQFCDMLQLTAENNYLYQNCESAMGGINQNTIAVFIQQYKKLLMQF